MKFLVILLCSLLAGTKPEIVTNMQSNSANMHKNIVVYFSGSDWCSICHKFKEEILSEGETSRMLTDNFIYYNADFPHRSKLAKDIAKANEYLIEQLNPLGVFPFMVITDENLKIYAQFDGRSKADDVMSKMKNFIRE